MLVQTFSLGPGMAAVFAVFKYRFSRTKSSVPNEFNSSRTRNGVRLCLDRGELRLCLDPFFRRGRDRDGGGPALGMAVAY